MIDTSPATHLQTVPTAPARSRHAGTPSRRFAGALLALGVGLMLPAAALAQVEVGPDDFRISHAGPDGSALYDATHDGLAFNAAADEYLVVWDADDQIPELGPGFNGKREIFGRLIDGDGTPVAAAFRIATAGPALNAAWDAANPETVYNELENQYFVVWVQTVAAAADGRSKREIFGRRLGAGGGPLGPAVRISRTGSDGNLERESREPSLTFNPTANEYLVVWQREEPTSAGNENEIYAQRLRGGDGALVGEAIRVSTMGPDGSSVYDASDPDVTYNVTRNEYLVVWGGDDDRAPLVDDEREIFAQRLTAQGAQVGPDDLRISRMGPAGDPAFGAEDASVAYAPDLDQYLIAWTGTDDLVQGEEVFVQRLSGAGQLLGPNRAVSDSGPAGGPGPPGGPTYHVDESLVTYHPTLDEYFVIWIGEDQRGLLRAGEFEVFGQRLTTGGDEIGTDDVRLSSVGGDGDNRFAVFSIGLTYNTIRDEYLVVFSGDDDRGSQVDDEVEIFGQRVAPGTLPCNDDERTVCLAGGRFEVRIRWQTNQGTAGDGMARRLSGDTGWFWFFNQNNAEVVVKVLDARPIGSGFWVFFGALSNVEYEVVVTDTVTRRQRVYYNPDGDLASRADTAAFPAGSLVAPPAQGPLLARAPDIAPDIAPDLAPTFGAIALPAATPGNASGAMAASCAAATAVLCLNGDRFRVEVQWADGFGNTGAGQARDLTDDTGWFWFFRETNVELIVKVLDARPVNGFFWVFYGALSNVEYSIEVTDTVTAESKTHENPAGRLASVADTRAFPLSGN